MERSRFLAGKLGTSGDGSREARREGCARHPATFLLCRKSETSSGWDCTLRHAVICDNWKGNPPSGEGIFDISMNVRVSGVH